VRFNHECVVNADCADLDPDNPDDPARTAVALMQWVSGAWVYICSGGLIADMDESTNIPYFLTANHCISRGNDARNMETFFQLIATCGETNCNELFNEHPPELRTLGATINDTGKQTDHTLMTLNQAAPSGSSFLGWNSTPIAFADGTPLFRISHPSGAPQAYSEHEVETTRPACGGWPRGNFIYSHDLFGTTEGGSSGSPLLNAGSQVVGQLTGGCGGGGSGFCDYTGYSTVDGAFANYFDDLREFLDPQGGSCTPAPEVCDDDKGNDCDGLIDAADPDCQTPSCDLKQKGDVCSADAECCSNKCRGRAGAQVCR
jgi:lysyl endopeptidase